MVNKADLEGSSTEMLVELAQRGDGDAYRQLHQRYNDRLLRGLRLSMPPDLADDASQEAWVRAYEKLDDLDRRSSFFAWLATIARNSARSLLRSPEMHTIQLEGTAGDAVDRLGDPHQAAELREREEAARTALAKLPSRQRRALQLRWMEGWSHRAIATMTGQSLSAVETLLYRARSNFHRQYESELSGVEASDGFACYKVRAQIRRLGEGRLSERRRARVLTHLDRCVRCRTVHAEMGETWQARGWMPFLAVPGWCRDFLASLFGRFAPASTQVGAAAPVYASAGAVLVIGAGVLVTTVAVDTGSRVAETEPAAQSVVVPRAAATPAEVVSPQVEQPGVDLQLSELTRTASVRGSDIEVSALPVGAEDGSSGPVDTEIGGGAAVVAPVADSEVPIAAPGVVSSLVDSGTAVVTAVHTAATELVQNVLSEPLIENSLEPVGGVLTATTDVASSLLSQEP